MVTLYGKGAIQIHAGKDTYVPVNGQITVPEAHMQRLLDLGWSRNPPTASIESAKPEVPPAPAVPAAAQLAPLNLDRLHAAVWDLNRAVAWHAAAESAQEALQATIAGAPSPEPWQGGDRVTAAVERLNTAIMDHLTAPEGEE